MKKYHKITHINTDELVEELLTKLAQNKGKAIDGYCYKPYDSKFWKKGMINGYSGDSKAPFRFVKNNKSKGSWYANCAIIKSVNPRDVPDGVLSLPEDKPWLAFLPKEYYTGRNILLPYVYCFCTNIPNDEWDDNDGKGYSLEDFGGNKDFLAIDVRAPEALKIAPAIVKAMGYEEPPKHDFKVGDKVTIDNRKAVVLSVDGELILIISQCHMGPLNHVIHYSKLKKFEPTYGYTDDGKPVVIPEGYELVPEGAILESGHRYMNVYNDVYKPVIQFADARAKILGEVKGVLRNRTPKCGEVWHFQEYGDIIVNSDGYASWYINFNVVATVNVTYDNIQKCGKFVAKDLETYYKNKA